MRLSQKRRRLNYRAKILIGLVGFIVIAAIMILYGRSQISAKNSGYITFEIGEPVSTQIDDYLNLYFYSESEKQTMSSEMELIVDDLKYIDEDNTLPAIGTYTAILRYDGHIYPLILTYQDTLAPTIECPEIFPYMDEEFDLNTAITVSDNSMRNCEVSINADALDLSTQGKYTVSVSATDVNGNSTTQSFNVEVRDISAPELSGVEDIFVPLNSSVSMSEGILATDNVDGDCTANIQTSGEVDYSQVGAYPVTYTNQDSAGNETSASRTIYVGESSLRLDEVPMILQMPEYYNGCEATCATMLLQYYGYDISLEEMAESVPSMTMETVDGQLYGPDPNEAFAGNMSETGYGVYLKPILNTMQNLIDAKGGSHQVRDLTGSSAKALYYYLNTGHPVQVWVTTNMLDVSYSDTISWYVKQSDGTYTETEIVFPLNEHCLVLIGYDEDSVYLNDPLRGLAIIDKTDFETAYASMGAMALIIE